MDQIDNAISKTSRVLTIGQRSHRRLEGDYVEVEFVASVIGVDEPQLRFTVENESIKSIFSMLGLNDDGVTAQFLGCNEPTLQP